ncbi:hypothetical protein SPWS13_1782 [Shewanella putrefaciens]|nr:hypothetical protein SPWS13_1782 [Shewanella putrefaciens]
MILKQTQQTNKRAVRGSLFLCPIDDKGHSFSGVNLKVKDKKSELTYTH